MPHTNFAVRAAAWRKKNEEKGHIRSVSQIFQGNAAFNDGRGSGRFRGSGLLSADEVAREARATAPAGSGTRFYWGKTPSASYTADPEPECDDPFFLPVSGKSKFDQRSLLPPPQPSRPQVTTLDEKKKGKKTSPKTQKKGKTTKGKKPGAQQELLAKLHTDPFLELPVKQQSTLEKRNERKFKAVKFFEKVRVERLIKRLQTEESDTYSLETLKDMHNYIVHYPRALPYYSVFKKPASEDIGKVRELITQTLKEKVAEGELEDATEIFERTRAAEEAAKEAAKEAAEASSQSDDDDDDDNDDDDDGEEESQEESPKKKQQTKRQRR